MLIDFSSSLYLGQRHPSTALPAWTSLTTGAPAALVEPPGSARVARLLAAASGCERGVLLPSTLHVFLDLLGHGLPGAALFWDEALYPVAALGVELARCRGVPAQAFPHLGPAIDARWLRRRTARGRRPVIVSDGFCVGCGQAAPLGRYARAVAELGGFVVVDDTQAFGLLGANPTPEAPFGRGGGGSCRHQRLEGAPVLIGTSLAKAFGVPIAALLGPRAWLGPFVERSRARVHSSPASQPVILAAERVLRGAADAERRRGALGLHLRRWRRGLAALGLRARGGLLPVQSIPASDLGGREALARVHAALLGRGVRSLICRARCCREPALTFILRADHTPEQIARALRELGGAVHGIRRGAAHSFPGVAGPARADGLHARARSSLTHRFNAESDLERISP